MKALPTVADDGLATPDVGGWAEQKYQLVRYYADIFSNAMSAKWQLVYADIFAGAGHAKLRDSDRIVPVSAILVLNLPKPFTRYVYSELDAPNAVALEARAKRHAPDRHVVVLQADSNAKIGEIVSHIPKQSLTFCFADPFRLENLKFATVQVLAEARRTDFLVLLPSGMDANRNETTYLEPSNRTVERFTSQADWRSRWPHPAFNFGDFVADEFGRAMKELGYQYESLAAASELIRNNKHAPLYRLAFFSRSEMGMKFWEEARKYTRRQLKLFE